MVLFWGGCDTLKGVQSSVEKTGCIFLDIFGHLQWLKGYSSFIDFIKNQSIGVA